jgi:hypothetical protein
MCLLRYHDIAIGHATIYRILHRLGLNRLPANQRYQRKDKRFKRYEKQQPATESRSTSNSSNRSVPTTQRRSAHRSSAKRPSNAAGPATTSSPPSMTAPDRGYYAAEGPDRQPGEERITRWAPALV